MAECSFDTLRSILWHNDVEAFKRVADEISSKEIIAMKDDCDWTLLHWAEYPETTILWERLDLAEYISRRIEEEKYRKRRRSIERGSGEDIDWSTRL